jgi:folate-dependent phosphoribosylglycinamide formyltransferase PurN
VSGPTIHLVDEQFDSGLILAQSCVPVHPDDTPASLAARVLKEEHQLYPQAVAAMCDGRIRWREGEFRVPYIVVADEAGARDDLGETELEGSREHHQ